MIGSLRMTKGIFAGYHMNKGNRISVLLDDNADEEPYQLIGKSHGQYRTGMYELFADLFYI